MNNYQEKEHPIRKNISDILHIDDRNLSQKAQIILPRNTAVDRENYFMLGFAYKYKNNWNRLDEIYLKCKHAWLQAPSSQTTYYYVSTLGPYMAGRSLWDDYQKLVEKSLEFVTTQKMYFREAKLFRTLASILLNSGQPIKAIKEYRNALFRYSKIKDVKEIAYTLIEFGGVFQELKQLSKTISNFENALSIFVKIQDDEGIAKASTSIGMAYHKQGRLPEALPLMNQSIIIYENHGNTKDLAKTFNQLAIIYNENGNFEKSIEYHSSALKLFSENKDRVGIASTITLASHAYAMLGKSKSVLNRLRLALTLCEEEGNTSKSIDILIRLGNYYCSHSYWNQSIAYFQHAGDIAEKTSDFLSLGIILNNLGKAYYEMDNKNQALGYFERALMVFQNYGEINQIATSLINIGNIHQIFRHPDLAFTYFERALQIVETTKDMSIKNQILNSLGVLFLNRKEYSKARHHFTNASELIKEKKDEVNYSITYLNLGKLNLAQLNLSEALILIHKYFKIKLQIKDYQGIILCLQPLSMIYDQFDEPTKAIEYLKLFLSEACNHDQTINDLFILINIFYALRKQWSLPRLLKVYNNIKDKTIGSCINEENGQILYYFGLILRLNGQFEQALDIFKYIQKNHRDFRKYKNTIPALNQICWIYHELKTDDKALGYYQKLIPLLRENKNRIKLAQVYSNIALIYSNKSNWELSISFYEKAIDIWNVLMNLLKQAELKTKMANIYELLNRHEIAASLNLEVANFFSCSEDYPKEHDALVKAITNLSILNRWEKIVPELHRIIELDQLLGLPRLEQDVKLLQNLHNT